LAFDTRLTRRFDSFTPLLEHYILSKALDAAALVIAMYEECGFIDLLLQLNSDQENVQIGEIENSIMEELNRQLPELEESVMKRVGSNE